MDNWGHITPKSWVITLLKTGRGPLCIYFQQCFFPHQVILDDLLRSKERIGMIFFTPQKESKKNTSGSFFQVTKILLSQWLTFWTFGDSIFSRENKPFKLFFQGPGRLSEELIPLSWRSPTSRPEKVTSFKPPPTLGHFSRKSLENLFIFLPGWFDIFTFLGGDVTKQHRGKVCI